MRPAMAFLLFLAFTPAASGEALECPSLPQNYEIWPPNIRRSVDTFAKHLNDPDASQAQAAVSADRLMNWPGVPPLQILAALAHQTCTAIDDSQRSEVDKKSFWNPLGETFTQIEKRFVLEREIADQNAWNTFSPNPPIATTGPRVLPDLDYLTPRYKPPRSNGTASPPPRPGYRVEIFYATDRAPLEVPGKDVEFSGDRGATLSLGSMIVSIPPNHVIGKVERPGSFLWYEFSENPLRDIVVQKTSRLTKDEFFKRVGNAASKAAPHRTFIFVHGYNVDFKTAALRTAQIAVDLDADSVPVLYSWPSQGATPLYTYDEANAEWTEANMKAFLEMYADQSGSDEIVVIAHSMGARAATRAVSALLSARHELIPRFKELILAAPDIDAAVFVRDLVPAYRQLGENVTMYVSSKDKALMASKEVHAREPRAGDSEAAPVIAAGVETIDASLVNTDFLGHSTFMNTRTILTDMNLLMRRGMRAGDRPGLTKLSTPEGTYWAFRP